MKIEWKEAWDAFWDQLAERVRGFGVQFLAGDFNMSLTEVPKQLRKRGIACDCVAWYRFMDGREPDGIEIHGGLGLDSCGIIYIGGRAEVNPTWKLSDMEVLTALEDKTGRLDVYQGSNRPGHPWRCFQPKRIKKLEDKLKDLLDSPTTPETLQQIPRRPGSVYRPHLRLKQKMLDIGVWLVNGEVHNGAHFPLCMFTMSSRARSEDALQRRALKSKAKSKGRASRSRGKGKKGAQAAVAECAPDCRKGNGEGKGEGAGASTDALSDWSGAWEQSQDAPVSSQGSWNAEARPWNQSPQETSQESWHATHWNQAHNANATNWGQRPWPGRW